MPICPSGSSAKPDAPSSILLTPENASRFLPAGVNWMHDFLRFLGPLFIDVPAMCALDPPEFPEITLFDVLNLVTGGRTGGYITAAEKFNDVMRHVAWYTFCQCDGAATPALPTPPAPPADLPVIDPPILVPPASSSPACYSRASASGVSAGGPFEYDAWLWHGVPSTLSSIRVTIHQPLPAAAALQPVVWKVFFTTNSAATVVKVVELPPAFDHQVTLIPPPGATELRVQGTSAAAQSAVTTILIEGFCGDTPIPGLGADSCCGPDPLVTTRLQQILDLVTLLQRQGEPFAYVPGPAVHSGLVGVGELDVEGLIGILIEVTTLPPELGHLVGMPDMLFDVGWLTVGTADGWERRIRIDAAEQLVMPAHMGLVTRVGYSLSPNVVISVHELVREP